VVIQYSEQGGDALYFRGLLQDLGFHFVVNWVLWTLVAAFIVWLWRRERNHSGGVPATAEFVTLSCPSCGGRLQITANIDRFACTHCGQEHLVKRAGGIVSLSPVVDALKKVELGVDKTASELAVSPIDREIDELRAQRATILTSSPKPELSPLFPLLLGTGIVLALLAILPENRDMPWVCIGPSLIPITIGGIATASHPAETRRWQETTGAQLLNIQREIESRESTKQGLRNSLQ
jgi:DNA-directed RNA polymerase subunit RPC12/RpoP